MDKMFNVAAIMEMAISATSFKDVDLVEEPTSNTIRTSGRKPANRTERRKAAKKAEKRRERMLADCGYSPAPQGRAYKYMGAAGLHMEKIYFAGEGKKKREPLPFSDTDAQEGELTPFWITDEELRAQRERELEEQKHARAEKEYRERHNALIAEIRELYSPEEISAAVETANNGHYVVINKSYGGFGLSPIASAMYAELRDPSFDTDAGEFVFRDDPALVATILLLGEKANGISSNLVAIKIPEGESFAIYDYDGWETVERPRVIFG